MDVGSVRLIRSTHPYAFRSGQWAILQGVVPADGRECYLVEFGDGATDFWAVGDPDAGYEFDPSDFDEQMQVDVPDSFDFDEQMQVDVPDSFDRSAE